MPAQRQPGRKRKQAPPPEQDIELQALAPRQNKKKRKAQASSGGADQQEQPAPAQPQPPLQSPAAALQSAAAAPAGNGQTAPFKNKEKILILCTRGITFRYRHLLTDIATLIPHSKRDAKLDTKRERTVINEVADEKSCTGVLFFEARKRTDLYLWMGKAPGGPCVKFLVQNVHTMDELKLTGNHLKGSRPVLSFDPSFDGQPHWQLLKELLTQTFATPRRHHKSKPFFDHVLSFTIADERIWFRNYQVVVPLDKGKASPRDSALVEVGPRFCLQPIKIFAGSFGGATLYENPAYVSPNALRSLRKKRAAGKYSAKVTAKAKRRAHEEANPMPKGALDDVFR